MVVITVLLGVFMYFRRDPSNPGKRAVVARNLVRLFGVLFVLAAACFLYIMEDPARWTLDPLKAYVNTLSHLYSEGVIIKDRPETYHSRPGAFGDYVFILIDRFWHFFAFYVDGFSLKHKILNILFFPAAYVLSSITIFELFWKNSQLSAAAWRLSFLCAAFILMTASFHSVILVDYDWRFRLPCMPPLIVLSGVGAMQVKSHMERLWRQGWQRGSHSKQPSSK